MRENESQMQELLAGLAQIEKLKETQEGHSLFETLERARKAGIDERVLKHYAELEMKQILRQEGAKSLKRITNIAEEIEKRFAMRLTLNDMDYVKAAREAKGFTSKDPRTAHIRQETEEEDTDIILRDIPRQSTLGELLQRLEEQEDALSDEDPTHFWAELNNQFPPHIISDFSRRDEKFLNTTIQEYFAERGYTLKDLEIALPLKFRLEVVK